jgi:hypothetical protein
MIFFWKKSKVRLSTFGQFLVILFEQDFGRHPWIIAKGYLIEEVK